MSGRRWSTFLVVVALAAVVLAIRPCGGDGRTARRGPELDARATSIAASPSSDATPNARRRGSPADEANPSTAPAAAPAKATVLVLVVAKDGGAPVVGADVLLSEETDDKHDVEHRAKTDDAGVARFDGLPPCTAMVRAWADGFVRSGFTGGAAKPGRELKLDIALDRGAPLEGVVLDARSGRPIAGAVVDVILGGSIEDIGSSGTSAPHLGLLTTGEDGRFRLRVPPDEMVTPTASARGFVPSGRTVIVHRVDKPSPLELRLEAGGALRGTVRASNGAAVAGARVYAVPADQRELLANPDGAVTGGGRRWTTLAATTDAAGRYELDGLARGGVYVAFAEADGWARSVAIERVLVTDAAPSADADFALRKLATLVVRVVDSDGKPHEGRVSIETSRDETFRYHPQEVDEDGATRFEDVDPGRYRVAVQSNSAPAEFGSADVADGATAEITVRLPRGVAISGAVVDDRGRPVANAGVNASGTRSAADPSAPGSFGHGETRADGTFVVNGLREEPHRVRTYKDLHADTDHGSIDAPAKDVRLVLPRTAKATLRLVAPRGAAPPAEILVRGEIRTTPSPGAPETWSAGGAEPQPFGDGSVVVAALAPGPCRVRVMSKEFAPIVREFTAKPGETIDLGEATLESGVDMAGRVEDAAGTPVADARVTVGGVYFGDTVSPDVRMTSSGVDGSFRVEHLPTGPLDVTVAAPEFVRTTTRVDAAPGGGAVVVRLFRGASLTVTVVDAAGAPIPRASIVVRAANATSDETTDRADHRGVAEFRVAAGKCRVAVEDKDAAADVDLVEGGETSVRLVVK